MSFTANDKRFFPRDFTVLLIDHDMDVTFEIAEKVMVLHYGQLLVARVPGEVKSNPRVQEIYMESGRMSLLEVSGHPTRIMVTRMYFRA